MLCNLEATFARNIMLTLFDLLIEKFFDLPQSDILSDRGESFIEFETSFPTLKMVAM